MLLSDELLSKRNHCLTIDTVRWVLKNLLSMEPNHIYRLKANATHPLMWEEALYDDLPIETLGLLAREPYFPRTHFNRAFSWMFGKESIMEIDAESFSHYEQRAKGHIGYAIGEHWRELPFTDAEYQHVFDAFRTLFKPDSGMFLTSCQDGLMRHRLLTPEIHERERPWFETEVSRDVCAEIANKEADKSIKRMKLERESPYCRKTQLNLIDDIAHVLRFKNLSRDRRDDLLSYFDIEIIGLTGIHKIYNGNIPDGVFDKLLKSDFINENRVGIEPSMLADMRLPTSLATQIALEYPIECAFSYFQRSDVDEAMRANCILALTHYQGVASEIVTSGASATLLQLMLNGLTTLSEIALIQERSQGDIGDACFHWSDQTGIEVPPAIQEKCIGDTFKTPLELKHYHDIPALVDAIRFMYARESSRDEQPKNVGTKGLSSALSNTRWTRDTLLALLDITREEAIYPPHRTSQGTVRRDLLRKLFSESFYPSLDRDDLTGPYGRAENLLARLLDGDAELLDELDIELIVNSRIRPDYRDAEVNLATSLAQHPELNDRLMAAHLKRQLELRDDGPALVPSRSRPAI